MARIAALIAMVSAFHFGGAALIVHDVHSVESSGQSARSDMNSITANFNAGVTALHNANSASLQ
jgi:hypothetical protein